MTTIPRTSSSSDAASCNGHTPTASPPAANRFVDDAEDSDLEDMSEIAEMLDRANTTARDKRYWLTRSHNQAYQFLAEHRNKRALKTMDTFKRIARGETGHQVGRLWKDLDSEVFRNLQYSFYSRAVNMFGSPSEATLMAYTQNLQKSGKRCKFDELYFATDPDHWHTTSHIGSIDEWLQNLYNHKYLGFIYKYLLRSKKRILPGGTEFRDDSGARRWILWCIVLFFNLSTGGAAICLYQISSQPIAIVTFFIFVTIFGLVTTCALPQEPAWTITAALAFAAILSNLMPSAPGHAH